MGIYYTKNHEWVKVDYSADTSGSNKYLSIVGITDYAASQLGDIVFIKLPEQKEIKQSEVLCEIESVKAASDIFSPLSGRVVAANLALETKPELINESAQDQGWIVKLEIYNPDELNDLMDQASYKQYIQNLK